MLKTALLIWITIHLGLLLLQRLQHYCLQTAQASYSHMKSSSRKRKDTQVWSRTAYRLWYSQGHRSSLGCPDHISLTHSVYLTRDAALWLSVITLTLPLPKQSLQSQENLPLQNVLMCYHLSGCHHHLKNWREKARVVILFLGMSSLPRS